MNAKLLILFLALGSLLFMPTLSYSTQADAQWGWTDEEFEYLGSDNGNLGPRSIVQPLVKGVLSYTSKTITNTFSKDLGVVTVQIENESGTVYVKKTIDTSKEKSLTIDISMLESQSYKITCTFATGTRVAHIDLK